MRMLRSSYRIQEDFIWTALYMNNETILGRIQNNLSRRTILPVEKSEGRQDAEHAHPPPHDQEYLQTEKIFNWSRVDPCFCNPINWFYDFRNDGKMIDMYPMSR